MRVDFYDLTRAPLESVLPSICEKLLANGERLVVVTGADRVAALDRLLWSFAPQSFLPHAPAGGDNDADQPVLIGDAVSALNGARNVALADGRWREAALGFERIFYFFDSPGVDEARTSWRALKDRDGAERHYWKQDEAGRWVEGP